MIQVRAAQSQAEARRRDLAASAGSVRATRHVTKGSQPGTAQRSAAGLPVPGGRAVHRAVAPRLGSWLISFGTRLGGAAVRPS
ncbi:MAG TPA: hypothetical protein VMF35_14155 [Acidimicrobiales bacterium]|nr:hypothetical protein [Acidimicrobiales bacterium]